MQQLGGLLLPTLRPTWNGMRKAKPQQILKLSLPWLCLPKDRKKATGLHHPRQHEQAPAQSRLCQTPSQEVTDIIVSTETQAAETLLVIVIERAQDSWLFLTHRWFGCRSQLVWSAAGMDPHQTRVVPSHRFRPLLPIKIRFGLSTNKHPKKSTQRLSNLAPGPLPADVTWHGSIFGSATYPCMYVQTHIQVHAYISCTCVCMCVYI